MTYKSFINKKTVLLTDRFLFEVWTGLFRIYCRSNLASSYDKISRDDCYINNLVSLQKPIRQLLIFPIQFISLTALNVVQDENFVVKTFVKYDKHGFGVWELNFKSTQEIPKIFLISNIGIVCVQNEL